MTPKYVKRVHTIPASHPRHPSTVVSPDTELKLVVDDYAIPTAPDEGYTLVFTHGVSFNRAMWEMIIRKLLDKPEISSHIKRVLALDAVNHGDSALVNTGKLAKDKTFWLDHSKDILKVLEYFRVGPRAIGIGHSLGGGTLSHAALMAPSAFTATILIEPIIFQFAGRNQIIANETLKRPDKWASYEEAREAMIKCESGTYWTLKTTKEQEAGVYFSAPIPELPDLLAKSRQPHYYLLGQKSRVFTLKDRAVIKNISNSPGWVKILPGVGHLIPMTHPNLLVEELAAITIENIRPHQSAKL
ncbi:Alpha/beta hydrolase fold-1 [Macrophomina phaseolina MS6]|uniref:Alpha/beta hydrolase fold-1 n=1 Tax=Macrophomina phaseolina (strain MS6) TaxID=1126212 RepID=K2R647_MACPH|nr:Alpha/beta hydrolase fold-1 [Macrophomina phaseolina MS6]